MLVVIKEPRLTNRGTDARIQVAAQCAFGTEAEHGSPLRGTLIGVNRLPLAVRREVIDVVAVVIGQARVGLPIGMVLQARAGDAVSVVVVEWIQTVGRKSRH